MSDLKHALLVTRVWGSQHGGSVYCAALVRALESRGWSVTVLAERFEQELCGAVRLRGFFGRDLRVLPRKIFEMLDIFRLAIQTPGACLIAQGDLPRLFYVALQYFVPLVFIRQDAILTCPGNDRYLPKSRAICSRRFGLACLRVHERENCLGQIPFHKRVGRVLLRVRDRVLLRFIRHFVVNSEYVGRIHERAAEVLYPRLNPVRDGSPTHTDAWDASTQAVCSTNRRDLYRLVFCGRLERVKGAADALMILRLLPECYSLDIIGGGPEQQALGEAAESFRLRNRVRFHGWVNPHVRDDVLRSAGLLLMTSRCAEAFGMAGMEAFAQGTPVVGYRAGGIAEWCREGAGWLVDCRDVNGAAAAVLRLTANPMTWRAHSQAAERLALQYANRFGQDLDRIISQVHRKHRAGAASCRELRSQS